MGSMFTINSPLSGTFYTAPSPDDEHFVEEGQLVNSEDVVCIIESMKVFTELRTERKGIIRRCLVENEDPVMIHQPLFEVEAA
jgi:acetyl-CoA carboxylase biotin carboxyl carrier protein